MVISRFEWLQDTDKKYEVAQFSLDVKNQGNASAGSSYLIIHDPVFGVGGKYFAVNSLSSGEVQTITGYQAFPGSGTFRLNASADRYSNVDESDETNNSALTSNELTITE